MLLKFSILIIFSACFSNQKPQAVNKQNPSEYVTKGVIYLREYDRGNKEALKKAAAAFEIASQINQDLPEVLDGLGCVALREGKIDSSEGFFNRVTLLYPNYSRAWVNKAHIAELRGDLDNAELYLREALRINDFDVHALNNLSVILIRKSREKLKESESLETQEDIKDIEENLARSIIESSGLIFRASELSGSSSDIVEGNVKLFKEKRDSSK